MYAMAKSKQTSGKGGGGRGAHNKDSKESGKAADRVKMTKKRSKVTKKKVALTDASRGGGGGS